LAISAWTRRSSARFFGSSNPAAIEAALGHEHRRDRRGGGPAPGPWTWSFGEARYEEERARRQYDVVEPDHRLVVERLERCWNTAIARVLTLEDRLLALDATAATTCPPDRARLLQLVEDFPRVWTEAATHIRLKRRIARLLIEETSCPRSTAQRHSWP
jgi:hypothetical protein